MLQFSFPHTPGLPYTLRRFFENHQAIFLSYLSLSLEIYFVELCLFFHFASVTGIRRGIINTIDDVIKSCLISSLQVT